MDPMDRIRSRIPLADLNIGKQHLLSKVIGKRFAAAPPHPRAGLVEIVNLDRLDAKSRFLGPNGFGYVTNFVRYASKSLEELWQTVENNFDNTRGPRGIRRFDGIRYRTRFDPGATPRGVALFGRDGTRDWQSTPIDVDEDFIAKLRQIGIQIEEPPTVDALDVSDGQEFREHLKLG